MRDLENIYVDISDNGDTINTKAAASSLGNKKLDYKFCMPF